MQPRTMIWVGAIGLGSATLGALTLLPSRSHARPAAWRSQSLNHLHNMGVATFDYEYTSGQFFVSGSLAPAAPPGARHGWQSQMLPFIEQKPLHSTIDFHRAWDDPVNLPSYRSHVGLYLNPGISPPYTGPTGEALTHYAGNSHVLPPETPLLMSDVTDGASTTALLGEVISDYSPWGKPGNVRDPAAGLHAGSGTFGGPWKDGSTQFTFLDGRATALNPDIDPAVLRALATPAGGESVKIP